MSKNLGRTAFLTVFFTVVIATMLSVAMAEDYTGIDDVQDVQDAQDAQDAAVASAEISDPLEKINRVLFHGNKMANRHLIFPVHHAYRDNVPEFFRDMLHNVISTASEPVNALNAALQGEFADSGQAIGRFLINVTLGVAGLNDVATEAGVEEKHYGFNTTLRYYGVGTGIYLMMPIFGPSSARHLTGIVADYAANPFAYILDSTGKMVVLGAVVIDNTEQHRDTMENIERIALDEYATVRSLFAQKNN